jgi:hypothetical protein
VSLDLLSGLAVVGIADGQDSVEGSLKECRFSRIGHGGISAAMNEFLHHSVNLALLVGHDIPKDPWADIFDPA